MGERRPSTLQRAWHGRLPRASSATVTHDDIEAARRSQAEALETFSADFQVWENKRPATKVMQSGRDGRFRQVREWVGQFYMPASSGRQVQAKLDGVLGIEDFPRPGTQAREAGFEDDCFQFLAGYGAAQIRRQAFATAGVNRALADRCVAAVFPRATMWRFGASENTR